MQQALPGLRQIAAGICQRAYMCVLFAVPPVPCLWHHDSQSFASAPAETSPPKVRGLLISLKEALIVLGIMGG